MEKVYPILDKLSGNLTQKLVPLVCSLVRDAPSCFLPSVVGTCPVCIQLGQSFDGPECESVAAGIPATGP
jgi:hypothetical protein